MLTLLTFSQSPTGSTSRGRPCPLSLHSAQGYILNEQYIYFNYDNLNSHYLMDCHICQNMSASWADSDTK